MRFTDDIIKGLILGQLFQGAKTLEDLNECYLETMKDFAETGEQEAKELKDVVLLPRAKLLSVINSLISGKLVEQEEVEIEAKVLFEGTGAQDVPEMKFLVMFYRLGSPAIAG